MIDRLEPAVSRRDALIGRPPEFAESISADPACLKSLVYEPNDDATAPSSVIHGYESIAIVTCHSGSQRWRHVFSNFNPGNLQA